MSWKNFFNKSEPKTANKAKERLQIIVAERRCGGEASYIPQLKQDILNVLKKYVHVEEDMVDVSFDQMDNETSVLELNVRLPDEV